MLGILAVNVASFAATDSAGISPDLPRPGTFADHAAWLAMFVLFEGKMRALFSMLFGASLLLFIERNETPGRHGARLQARRLMWLMVFGYLHFLLIWDGDILFLYGMVGLLALLVRDWTARQLVIGAAAVLMVWQAWGTSMWGGSLLDEAAVISRDASPAEIARHTKDTAWFRAAERRDADDAARSWPGQVRYKVKEKLADPLNLVGFNWGETLPWMMIGMALLRSGFFAGAWPPHAMRRLAGTALLLGGSATVVFAWWAANRHYPEVTMHFAMEFGLVLPHTALALGYAALLVRIAPLPQAGGAGGGPVTPMPMPTPSPSRLREGNWPLRLLLALRDQLEAAGRMAFTNYIATSLVMTALCQDWGLGLHGQFGAAQRWTLVFLMWALILAWSQPWLDRFRQGPLEWAWRSLTEWRWLPLRR